MDLTVDQQSLLEVLLLDIDDEFTASTLVVSHLIQEDKEAVMPLPSISALVSGSAHACAAMIRDEHPRMHGFSEHLLAKDDIDFFRNVRMTKKTFYYVLEKIEKGYIPLYRGGNKPVTCSTALLVALWYLGNKATYREISEQFGLSESTVYDCVTTVINILVKLADEFIKWPSALEANTTESDFRNMAEFPGVIGAVDGCHIEIKAPADVQADFLDRTHRHSVNLMAICDSHKKFTYIHAGFPGSAHDNRVFKSTNFYSMLQTNPSFLFPTSNFHIIGDSGFQNNKYVLVPYRDMGNLSAVKLRYNKRLSQTRYVVENAFALLKGRFRRLKYIDANIPRVTLLVISCCVLHNITLDFPAEESMLAMEAEVELAGIGTHTSHPDIELPSDLESEEKRSFIASLL